MTSHSKRDFLVTATITETRELFIPSCSTPEEAISIAEQLIEEGELGSLIDREVLDTEALPEEGFAD